MRFDLIFNIVIQSCDISAQYFPNALPDYNSKTADEDENDVKDAFMIDKINELLGKIQISMNTKDMSDNNVYYGNSGIAYMYWYLWRHNSFNHKKEEYLQLAVNAIKQALTSDKYQKPKQLIRHSLLFGNIGTLVVACLVFDSINDEINRDFYLDNLARTAEYCVPIDFESKESTDDYFMERAGYICGSLTINKYFGNNVIPNVLLQELAKCMLKAAIALANKGNATTPVMLETDGIIQLGSLNGLSSVLLALLSMPDFGVMSQKYQSSIKTLVDFMLSMQEYSGTFPYSINNKGEATTNTEHFVQWCNGSSGICWLMAKAYCIWKQDKYMQSCIKCAEIAWTQGLIKKCPGVCHGIAGNGYTLLIVYKITSDLKYLYRAKQFAKFLFSETYNEYLRSSATKYSTYSLFEGWTGVVCFLADLLQPEQLVFPLYFDVFYDYTDKLRTIKSADSDNDGDSN